MSDKKRDIPVEELKEVLDIVGQKIPALIKGLKDSLFSEEAGRELGKAVGVFYKELVAAGIPSDEAMQMARSYIGTMQGVLKQSGNWKISKDDD
ncbi:MAG: hypothetical protein AB1331_01165 [Bacillota bacterium]